MLPKFVGHFSSKLFRGPLTRYIHVTHVPWCSTGLLTRDFLCGGENVPSIPDACATRNISYLVKGPLWSTLMSLVPMIFSNITSYITLIMEHKFYHCSTIGINTLGLRQNGGYFGDGIFKCIVLCQNFWIWHKFIELCSLLSNWQ